MLKTVVKQSWVLSKDLRKTCAITRRIHSPLKATAARSCGKHDKEAKPENNYMPHGFLRAYADAVSRLNRPYKKQLSVASSSREQLQLKDTDAGTTPDKSPLDVHRANTRGQSSSSWEKCDLYLMFPAHYKAYCAFHWAKLAWACDIHSSHPCSQASKNELQLIMELNYIYWTTLESNHYTYLEKPNSLMLAGWRRTVVATGPKGTRNRKDMAHFHHNTEWLLSAYDPACKQRHSL